MYMSKYSMGTKLSISIDSRYYIYYFQAVVVCYHQQRQADCSVSLYFSSKLPGLLSSLWA
jgi:hypothetical protein